MMAKRGSRGVAVIFNLGSRWGGWSTPRPGRFIPGMTRYPLCRRLDGPQGRSGRVQKISPTTEIRSPDRPPRRESLYGLCYPGPALSNTK